MKLKENTLTVILLSICLASCSNLKLSSVAENTLPDYYFPLEPFQDTSFPGSTQSNIYYAQYLRAFEEESLYKQSGEIIIYRFTWLRTFHHPVMVRVENINDKLRVYWKVMDGMGGYGTDTLLQNERSGISFQNWNELDSLIDETDFWNLPQGERKPPNTDGSNWLLEGYRNGNYHLVDRHSPKKDQAIYVLGTFILQLTNLQLDAEAIY
ncbi:hypothetical protein [Owenweeksia hongkongensis]|uniref:hypothetical protein n=1 Tax=Owenweeksia hongkongensis TaxID=253245 RepID=UPI003A8FE328